MRNFRTRSEAGICEYKTWEEAVKAAEADKTIWNISFLDNRERVNLIKITHGDKETWEKAPALTDS